MTTIKDENAIIVRFGGGINSRASIDEIHPREASSGKNFLLDFGNSTLKNRPPFDKIGTMANAGEIRGGGTLIKSDGTIKAFFQAGDTVYDWTNGTSFSSIATVDSSAKLRGRLEHNWQLDDKVIVTDINLSDVVMEWDGTTFQDVTFTKNDVTSPTAFGTFKAKYCIISNERVYYANVNDGSTTTPHLIVGSLRGNHAHISVADRPSSSLSAEDPFFLIQPDYRAINGALGAFGVVVTSSDAKGSMFYLTGSDATDFSMDELFPRSGASGDESVVYVGNDVLYGRESVIESLKSTDTFGDVETDDVSITISDSIDGYKDWTAVYNSRTRLCYFFPDSQGEAWVLNKSILDSGQLSPWMKYTTQNALSFQPTFAMNMLDPADGLEYVFMGDSSGNIYRMEGSTGGDDGANVNVLRSSGLFSATLDAEVYDLHGWIKYKKNEATQVTLRILYQGKNIFNEEIVFTIPAANAESYYSGGSYYSGNSYYGKTRAKVTRQLFAAPGQSNEFQIQIETNGTKDIDITEVGIRFEEVS